MCDMRKVMFDIGKVICEANIIRKTLREAEDIETINKRLETLKKDLDKAKLRNYSGNYKKIDTEDN